MFCKPSEWLSYVQQILCQNGFAYVWQSNGTCIDHTVFMRSFEQRIKDNFQQKCFAEINISNRCILYKAIVRKFEMQSIYYVCILIVIGKHCGGFVLAAIDYLYNAVDGHLYQDWIESVHYAMNLKTNIMSC